VKSASSGTQILAQMSQLACSLATKSPVNGPGDITTGSKVSPV